MGRKKLNAGKRKFGHDYRSKCIYHIVLKKDPCFEDFSFITGTVDSLTDKPRTSRYRAGEIIMEALSNLKNIFPFVSILRRCVMPDHVHFAIYIKEANRIHLGNAIIAIKTFCSQAWERLGHPAGIRFFIDGYHDTILRGKGQLQKMLTYISDNPRRWLVRRQYPGWFHRFRLQINGKNYVAYGNWDLLSEPEHDAVEIDSGLGGNIGGMEAVKVSSKYSEETLKARKWCWVNTVRNDGILVSPFISEAEKKVRDWAMENGGAIILLRAEPFGELYKPQGRYFELCMEGRLLEVYVPAEGEAEDEYWRRERKPSRLACQRMNLLAEKIAAGGAVVIGA